MHFLSMSRRRWLSALALAAALPAQAQQPATRFPEAGRTLRIVVPFAAGGGVDAAARLLGGQLQKQLGLTVIVDNKAGASGTIGGNAVRTAAADGYTLLFSAATHVMTRHVLSKPPYDPQADFQPVARMGEVPLMLVLSPSKPQTRLSELLQTIRQQPERWAVGIPAAGAPSHLATLKLARQAQLKLTYIPYKGTQPALVDVAGGSTDLLLDSMVSLLSLAKSGKVRPLAITSARRSALAPEVPTFAEAGLPGFTYESWYGVWAPPGTPAERLAVLNSAINTATAELAKSGALAQLGISPVSEGIEPFKRYISAEVAEGVDLLKTAGFQPE